MLVYQFRPIEKWPGEKCKVRKNSPFKSVWAKTLDKLEVELRHLKAANVVIQAAVTFEQIRNDGMLRGDARPSWPGVILSFDSKHGPLSYPCDTYHQMTANVHAVALALEALRAVDRYGVTRSAEQYKGWTALPPPAVNGDFHSPRQAAEFLAKFGESITGILRSKATLEHAYRRGCCATHPDTGGDASEFKRVQQAYEMLSEDK